MAAPHRPAAKAPTAEEFEVLKATSDELRAVDQRLQDAEQEIRRLMAFKSVCYMLKDQSVEWPRVLEYTSSGFGDENPYQSEWWQHARARGLAKSPNTLHHELERANALKTKLDDTQSALRCRFNELSRPWSRSLNIMDLPDELLLDIFELVENLGPCPRFYENLSDGRRDIKNTRLVCRRFCALSSQLLVRVVRVHFTELSLARLDEISRHPTISKGVRAVRVVLHLYNDTLTDWQCFVSHHADELEEEVNMFESEALWLDSDTPETACETASETIENAFDVVSTLTRLVSADPGHGEDCEGDEGLLARLDQVHEQYLALFERQESLIRSGRFSQVVSSAIARMPGARKLSFNDGDAVSPRESWEQQLMKPRVDVWDALFHGFMLLPMTGEDAKRHEYERPNYRRCVVDVIGAVRSAGTLLNSLELSLWILGRSGDLVPAPDIRQEFSSGLQQLKEFTFSSFESLDQNDAEHLNEFLSACLDTSSLQKLSLDIPRGLTQPDTPRIDVAKIMGSRSRHTLTDVLLAEVAIDLSKLELFLKRLPEPMHRLSLTNVYLLSGTWKEVLDALRQKKPRVVELSGPRGAECDGMSDKDYLGIFHSVPNHKTSDAELYIKNVVPQRRNPLQALKDGFDSEGALETST